LRDFLFSVEKEEYDEITLDYYKDKELDSLSKFKIEIVIEGTSWEERKERWKELSNRLQQTLELFSCTEEEISRIYLEVRK